MSGGYFQTYIAPTDATRLFLAIPDGFGFAGAPSAYRVRISVNEIPTHDVLALGALALALALALLGIAGMGLRKIRWIHHHRSQKFIACNVALIGGDGPHLQPVQWPRA